MTVPLAGVTLTEMDGGGAGGDSTKPAPPPPQPSVQAPAVRRAAERQIFRISFAVADDATLEAVIVVSRTAEE